MFPQLYIFFFFFFFSYRIIIAMLIDNAQPFLDSNLIILNREFAYAYALRCQVYTIYKNLDVLFFCVFSDIFERLIGWR